MPDLRFIKPADGRTVFGLAQGDDRLPSHGRGVAWDSYWQRRLDQGDVVETTEAAVRKGAAAAAVETADAAVRKVAAAADKTAGDNQ